MTKRPFFLFICCVFLLNTPLFPAFNFNHLNTTTGSFFNFSAGQLGIKTGSAANTRGVLDIRTDGSPLFSIKDSNTHQFLIRSDFIPGDTSQGKLYIVTQNNTLRDKDVLLGFSNTGVGMGVKNPVASLEVGGDIVISGTFRSTGPSNTTTLGSFENASLGPVSFSDTSGHVLTMDMTGDGAADKTFTFTVKVDGTSYIYSNPTVNASGKTFIIQHPLKPNSYLIHGAIEAPEADVLYCGHGQLKNGAAFIPLPGYFSKLTREGSPTIQLTASDGFDPLCVRTISGKIIHNGGFQVYSSNTQSHQKFEWVLKATRADISPLECEPLKKNVRINGVGPYTYGVKTKP